MKKVCDWLTANKLSLNVSKSNLVLFHPPRMKPNKQLDIRINNETVSEKNVQNI